MDNVSQLVNIVGTLDSKILKSKDATVLVDFVREHLQIAFEMCDYPMQNCLRLF